MEIRLVHGDVLKVDADVLVLKYAQDTYGVDDVVVGTLESRGHVVRTVLPAPGAVRLFDTPGVFPVRSVLFVGVVDLLSFDYQAIRGFSRRALAALATHKPDTAHALFTLHGVGFGLDESEAFRAELAGFVDAIDAREYPAALATVTIVERNEDRVRRLRDILGEIQPAIAPAGAATLVHTPPRPESFRSAGDPAAAKAHVFVAMSFESKFDDLFHYGIRQAVNTAGFLCERADLESFTGDVVTRVREKIETARFVVADLSTGNPNVYLEVGYAWGKRVPTVLLVSNPKLLKFDVKGHRCLVYKSIQTLEEALTRELRQLTGATAPD